MAYVFCNFQSFPLLWAASAKLLKKLQFPSFQWVSLLFSSFSFALGRSIRGNCRKCCNLHAFPTSGQPHFYDFIVLRGPSPLSFVHCQGFLRNLSMSLHNRWRIVCFLCNFKGFPLLRVASAKLLKKLQFPSLQWVSFLTILQWFHRAKGTKHKVPCGIWAWHYIETDGTWLIFSAIFKVFLCFGWLLPNCWKSCNFHAFPTAGQPHFYDFIVLRGPSPVSFVHCQGFLRNLSMSLHTNRWHMAYFLCNFLGCPLLWAASAKNAEKVVISRFPAEFVHVTTDKQIAHGLFPLQFSRFSFAWGGFCQTAEKVAISMFFPLQESLIFMISLR